MTSSLDASSSPQAIARFINSQDDQTPLSKGHMPEVTKAVKSFFASHAGAIITHVDTSLLDRITVEYTERGAKATTDLALGRSSSPSSAASPPARSASRASSTSASTYSDSPPATEAISAEFKEVIESKLSSIGLSDLSDKIVNHLEARFAPGTFSNCKLYFAVQGDWITMDYQKPLERGTYSFNKSVISF
jgi:hypothetical protein